MSKYCEVRAVVGQGTLGGALISQGVVDKGISEQFAPGGGDELTYGDVPLVPMIFQDDVLHCAGGIREARMANGKIDIVVKQLNVKFNEDKSFCICIGSKTQREYVRLQLEAQPLMCDSFGTLLKDKFKWLGQVLSEGGLAQSVCDTVESREGKIRGACLEISQIVNDWKSSMVGGMETAILLWEVCCIPSLLHGAGTWTNMSVATTKKLSQLQSWFLRLCFQVGPGAPSISLTWDTAVLDISM